MAEALQFEEDNEISLGDIFRTIWNGRGIIVGGLILGLALGIGAAFFSAARVNAVTEYYISLPTVSEGQYPSGAEFSPQDLLTPEVLSRVIAQTGIENAEDLQENLTVEYGTPVAEGLVEKYRARLSAGNLSAVEVDVLNAAFEEELEQATSNSLRLALNHGALGVSAEIARDILTNLPLTWSEVYATQFRVVDDARLPVSSVIWDGSMSTPAGAVSADRIVEKIRSGLQTIADDSRLLVLQTGDGLTIFDLQRRTDDLFSLYISPILGSMLADSQLVRANFESNRRNAEELELRLGGLRRNIDDIRSVMNAQVRGQAPGSELGGDQLQIDSSAISEIIALNNQLTLSEYLTRLLDLERETLDQKAMVQSRVRQLSTVSDLNLRQFVDQAEPLLKSILADYNEMVSAARELVRSQGTVLYRPISAPVEISSSPLRNGVTTIVALVFIALALSLLIVFIMSARRKLA